MTVAWLSRTEWGAPPIVYNSDGVTPRPALGRPASWVTVHYTGAARPLVTADRHAVIAAQQGLERFAQAAGKSNEYNYCLYAAGDVGYVVEYAGAYRAAHSEGENDRAVGVLFWVAVDQAVPDVMVDGYRWLRDTVLTPGGLYDPWATAQTPHRDMPGAATPCPGPVLTRWADLLAPYTNGGTVPTELLVRNGDDPNGPKDTAWNAFIVYPGGKYWLSDPDALNLRIAELGPPVDVSDTWMRAHGLVVGANPGADEWGCWKV